MISILSTARVVLFFTALFSFTTAVAQEAGAQELGRPVDLSWRRAEEAAEAVHSQENSPTACRFDDRRELGEDLEHGVDRGIVVGRVGLEQSQGGAERNGLGNELAGPDSRIMSTLGDLPDRASCAFSGREQGDRRAVELGRADELESKLEGREP